MIAQILNFLSLSIILYDTLGYLANYANKSSSDKIKSDYSRLVYTWVFYLSIKYIECTTCLSDPGFYLGEMFALVFSIVRLFIALPVTGVRAVLTKQVIEDDLLYNLLSKMKSCASSSSCNQYKDLTKKPE